MAESMDLVIGDGLNKTTIRESHETQSKVARLSQTVVSDNAVRKVNFRYTAILQKLLQNADII